MGKLKSKNPFIFSCYSISIRTMNFGYIYYSGSMNYCPSSTLVMTEVDPTKRRSDECDDSALAQEGRHIKRTKHGFTTNTVTPTPNTGEHMNSLSSTMTSSNSLCYESNR